MGTHTISSSASEGIDTEMVCVPMFPIYPFDPVVGEWKSQGTVAETFARIRTQFVEQQATPMPESRHRAYGCVTAVNSRYPHG
jgi:hypothetical protein